MRVAGLDCGTNTVRLLICEGTTTLSEVRRELRYVRLGEGVDATGAFSQAALERLFSTLDEYAAILDDVHPDRTRFVATSAARDATNREEFFAGVRARMGVEAEIITGEEEARLSFLGACSGGVIPPQAMLGQDGGGIIVTDLGGGSTELIRGSAEGEVWRATSLDVGSRRIRERFLHHDPPTSDEIADSRHHVSALLDAVALDNGSAWIGVAGTCTSLSAMSLRLRSYDRRAVHNSVVSTEQIELLAARLCAMRVEDTCAAFGSLAPERAEVIAAGALICSELARRVGLPMVVRETDILDGIAASLL